MKQGTQSSPQCPHVPREFARSNGFVQRQNLMARLRGSSKQPQQKKGAPIASFSDWSGGYSVSFDITQFRANTGYSLELDRVDALVWALTELLVEPMSNYGVFELRRQRAEALQRAKQPPPPPPPVYAIGLCRTATSASA